MGSPILEAGGNPRPQAFASRGGFETCPYRTFSHRQDACATRVGAGFKPALTEADWLAIIALLGGSMLRFFLLIFVFFILLPFSLSAGEPPPGAGIAGTKHDFTSERYLPYDNPQVTAVGLCTFCHTPHRGIKTRLLWNHTFPATDFYTWGPEKPATSGGTPLPKISPSYNGSTSFCLSCHDGSVGTAIGDINWFNTQAWSGSQAISRDKVTNVMGYHPTAIPYPYGGVPNRYNGVTTGYRVDLRKFVPDPSANGARLFHDNNGAILAGAKPLVTGIECSSCHDPHNGPQVKDSKFLRIDCESCHIR